jgi:hypothetical protein
LGRTHGFSEDFGHVEMLVSKAAQQEVWPLVQRWLKAPGGDVLSTGSVAAVTTSISPGH